MTTPLTAYLAYLLFFAAVFLLALQLTPRRTSTTEEEYLPGGAYRVVKPYLRSLATINRRLSMPGIKEHYRRQLALAGLFYDIDPDDFLAIKELVVAVLGAVGLLGYFYLWRDPIIVVVAMVIGFLLPDLRLRDLMRKRQRLILHDLPTFLDLLTLAVEAGLDLVGAIRKVTELSASGPLVEELKLYLKELMVGVSRRDALLNMAQKLDIPDFTAFVSAVVQAEEGGGSMSKILRIQSEDTRRKRFQRAEKLAGEAPVKMIFPLMAFIFPATFLVLFGALAFHFKEAGGF